MKLLFLLFLIVFCSSFRDENLYSSTEGDKEGEFYYFWHITDVHLDLNYTEGANPRCSSGLCCRNKEEGQTEFSGKFGYLSSHCDIPVVTVQGILDFIKTYPISSEDVLGIFYTGDHVAHDFDTQSEGLSSLHIKVFFEMLYNTFKDKIKVFGSTGNHDSFPRDQLKIGDSYFMGTMYELYKPWLTEKELEEVRVYGRFAADVNSGLKVIVLNNQWVNINNYYIVDKYAMREFDISIDFLRDELLKSKAKNQKVIIIGHLCPGAQSDALKSYVFYRYTEEYRGLVEEYKDVILTHLYGHEHHDRFQLMWNKDFSEVVSVGLLGPSMTSYSSHYPAVRLFKVNRTKNFEMIDIITFINDLKESNKQLDMAPNWKKEYSYKDYYDMNDLSPKSFQELQRKIEEEPPFFDAFHRFYYTGLEPMPVFGAQDKIWKICIMKYMNQEKIVECVKRLFSKQNKK